MGLILSFPPAERKPLARKTQETPDRGADILFFTGVRFCRRGEPDGNGGDEPVNGPDRAQAKQRRRRTARR